MNYYQWSLEYKESAQEIAFVIEKLKASKQGKSLTQIKEIDSKIAKYKTYYNECMQIANHLMGRYLGEE